MRPQQLKLLTITAAAATVMLTAGCEAKVYGAAPPNKIALTVVPVVTALELPEAPAAEPAAAPAVRLLVGSLEDVALPAHRQLASALAATGGRLHYEEYRGGHDMACWRGSPGRTLPSRCPWAAGPSPRGGCAGSRGTR